MAIVDWPEKILGCRIRKKLGKSGASDPLGIYGIYRVWRRWGVVQNLKQAFYTPTNPQTEAQQANRQKYADAIVAWQALTLEQKAVYNKKAVGLHMSGYNLFIREYMYG